MDVPSAKKHGTRVSVVGIDHDFLAFSRNVYALLCPFKSDRWLVRKQDVLLLADKMTETQFLLLYALGSCDDVKRHRLPYVKIFQFAQDQPDNVISREVESAAAPQRWIGSFGQNIAAKLHEQIKKI